jgi:hypothetical protein
MLCLLRSGSWISNTYRGRVWRRWRLLAHGVLFLTLVAVIMGSLLHLACVGQCRHQVRPVSFCLAGWSRCCRSNWANRSAMACPYNLNTCRFAVHCMARTPVVVLSLVTVVEPCSLLGDQRLDAGQFARALCSRCVAMRCTGAQDLHPLGRAAHESRCPAARVRRDLWRARVPARRRNPELFSHAALVQANYRYFSIHRPGVLDQEASVTWQWTALTFE